uniref:Uncharacterized protein n=1 Tax=Anguilla anguilla TaxID=7936 RepID=A0A0E9SED4_ANGAN
MGKETAITLAGENGQRPVLLLIAEDLSEVLVEAQAEAILIRSVSEGRSSEGLQSGSVPADQPAVVPKQGGEADREHGGRKEQEHDVEFSLGVRQPVGPEFYEVL